VLLGLLIDVGAKILRFSKQGFAAVSHLSPAQHYGHVTGLSYNGQRAVPVSLS
jgi:hypothetical protein